MTLDSRSEMPLRSRENTVVREARRPALSATVGAGGGAPRQETVHGAAGLRAPPVQAPAQRTLGLRPHGWEAGLLGDSGHALNVGVVMGQQLCRLRKTSRPCTSPGWWLPCVGCISMALCSLKSKSSMNQTSRLTFLSLKNKLWHLTVNIVSLC